MVPLFRWLGVACNCSSKIMSTLPDCGSKKTGKLVLMESGQDNPLTPARLLLLVWWRDSNPHLRGNSVTFKLAAREQARSRLKMLL